MKVLRKIFKCLKAKRLSGFVEYGQAVVEYAIILAILSIICVPIMLGVGRNLENSYENSALEILMNNYVINYNANGGTGAPESQTKQEKTDIELSSVIPTRVGHDFVGWARSSTAAVKEFSPGDTYGEDADLDLYAIWLQKTYTVSFNSNGGTGVPDNQTKIHGEDLVLTGVKPVKDGCDFLGWSTNLKASNAEYVSGAKYSKDEDAVLYAVWGTKTYSISYNGNGGTGVPSAQTKTHGTALTLSSTKPTRSGYTFLGWSTDSKASSASYTAGSRYTADNSAVLYAVWSVNTYTVTYNANGGTGAPSSQTKIHGQALTLSNTKPTRTDYNFLGWATSSGAASAAYSPGGSYTSNSSAVLYAVWEEDDTEKVVTISERAYSSTYDSNTHEYYQADVSGWLSYSKGSAKLTICSMLGEYYGYDDDLSAYDMSSGYIKVYKNGALLVQESLNDMGYCNYFSATFKYSKGETVTLRFDVSGTDYDPFGRITYRPSVSITKTVTM